MRGSLLTIALGGFSFVSPAQSPDGLVQVFTFIDKEAFSSDTGHASYIVILCPLLAKNDDDYDVFFRFQVQKYQRNLTFSSKLFLFRLGLALIGSGQSYARCAIFADISRRLQIYASRYIALMDHTLGVRENIAPNATQFFLLTAA